MTICKNESICTHTATENFQANKHQFSPDLHISHLSLLEQKEGSSHRTIYIYNAVVFVNLIHIMAKNDFNFFGRQNSLHFY